MSAIAPPVLDLTKPRVVALIVFTALVGMFLAVRRHCRRWKRDAAARLPRHLAGGVERSGDQPPARRAHRRADGAHRATGRSPTGQLTPRQVLVFALVLARAVDDDPVRAGSTRSPRR